MSTGFLFSTSRLRRPFPTAVVDVVALGVVFVAVITEVVDLPVMCFPVVEGAVGFVDLTVLSVIVFEGAVGFVDVPVANVAKVINKTKTKVKISI